MHKFLLVIAASFALASCGITSALTGLPSSPAAAANQTKLDEQVGLTVTLAYTAAARAAALAIRVGIVKDAATIAKIGELDGKAYAAVLAVRQAYLAGNSDGYLSAITQAREAATALLAAITGPVGRMDSPSDQQLAGQVVREMTTSATAIRLTDYRLAAAKGN